MDGSERVPPGAAEAGQATEGTPPEGTPPEVAPEPAPDAKPAASPKSGQVSTSSATSKARAASKGKLPPTVVELNRIVVTDHALAALVGLAAHEVPGLAGMAPVSLGEGLRRVLGLTQVDEGVVIDHPHGPGRADVDVHVVVAYGVNIPVVAESVRERVRYAAKHLAGIELDEVRVYVQGVSRG